MARIVSIGEFLWDVFPDGEKLGGAPFNFAYHAARLGHEVTLVSAVGDDDRGRKALARAQELGLATDFVQVIAGVETGAVTVRVDAGGQPDFTIHRPAAYDRVRLDDSTLARLAARRPEWLYYGTLYQAEETGRAAVEKLREALPDATRFYDINLRRNSYTRELVAALLPGAGVVKLNDEEAAAIDAMFGRPHDEPEQFTAFWCAKFGWRAMAVTLGARGCAVRIGADYAEPAGYPVQVADTVGAGDGFAAGFLHGLSQGWDARRTGELANRVGSLIAARPGGVPAWPVEEALQ